MKTNFIVIGGGSAGLTSALVLKKYGQVLLISKKKLDDCATNLAQGGIAAVVDREDSFESHIKDTLEAGCFHNNKKAVEYIVRHAPAAIEWLVSQGVNFDRKDGNYTPTREAAHSHHRVLHATDFTGQEIEKALINRVKQEKNISIWEDCFVMDLLVEEGVCFGVSVLLADRNFLARKVLKSSRALFKALSHENNTFSYSSSLGHGSICDSSKILSTAQNLRKYSPPNQSLLLTNNIINCFSRATILATGGLGQLYQWTTNPEVATGDGIALAYKEGVKVRDLEFIQFHPTALKDGVSPLFLLSEALRGEGGHLVKIPNPKSQIPKSQKGERFMKSVDSRAELAPRDIVARAIFHEQQRGFEVYLDIRHKGESFLRKRFPNIFRELKKRGFNLANDLIPVTPAAHYSCGGVATDLYGRTNIKNLFAFGEVACSGVHGANRLASNSLLEAAVFPLRLRNRLSEISDSSTPGKLFSRSLPVCLDHLTVPNGVISNISDLKRKLQRLMWDKVGIVRTKQGLREASMQIDEWENEIAKIEGVSVDSSEIKNMILVAKLITQAALTRKKSLGAHYIS